MIGWRHERSRRMNGARERRVLVSTVLAVLLCVSACTAGSPGETASTPPGRPARTATTTSPTASVTSPATPGRSPSAPTTSRDVGRAVHRGDTYLALGDSVSFGFREADSRPRPDYDDAGQFTGFPELVARRLGLHLRNASCPGETTGSLIDASAPSFGCERGTAAGSGGYRDRYPLHVDYSGSQLAYGVHYLQSHRDTGLVTLMIGANDAFRCAAVTQDRCFTEIGPTLRRVRRNVATILRALRGQAGYRGRLVLVTYYATDYESIGGTASARLNSELRAAARPFRVVVADGFGALERASSSDGGDACKAGLLVRLNGDGCGVHPSARGQRLLAGAVERVS